jgi:hypothetical protein
MPDGVRTEAEDRQNVKTALEAARIEIEKALVRADIASGTELADLKTGAKSLVAFVDFNSGCAAPALEATELLGRLRG